MRRSPLVRLAAAIAAPGLVLAGVLLAPLPARAQSAEAEVVAVVERLFDGMRARDTTLMRSTFDASARLYGLTRDGEIRVTPIDAFLGSIASGDTSVVLDEKIYAPEVRIDGNLASVWTFYTLHVGERFSHCGIDALILYRGNNGWKIVSLGDTRRTEGCDPPG